MPSFEDADAVAEVLTWLRGHPVTLDLLGTPDPSVSGILEAPWPHLIVGEGTNGDLRNMVWEQEQEVTLELVSDPTGAPGKAALRKQVLQLAQAALELPNQPRTATDVVVSSVRVVPTPPVYSKLSTGQLSYRVSLMVVVHPPLS